MTKITQVSPLRTAFTSAQLSVLVPIIHDDGERDATSDVEDYVLDDGVITVNDLLSFGPVGEPFVNGNENRDGISLFMTRRHRTGGMCALTSLDLVYQTTLQEKIIHRRLVGTEMHLLL